MTDTELKKIHFTRFPDVSNCNEDGLLAMGGDLDLNTLVSAYAQGIFPWFNDDQPILWWSPNPRMVLFPSDIKISRSLRKTLKNTPFQVTCNRAFGQTVHAARACVQFSIARNHKRHAPLEPCENIKINFGK